MDNSNLENGIKKSSMYQEHFGLIGFQIITLAVVKSRRTAELPELIDHEVDEIWYKGNFDDGDHFRGYKEKVSEWNIFYKN